MSPVERWMSARNFIFRFFGGVLGTGAAAIAIGLPLLFVAMETNEVHSYHGPISLPGAIGGSALIVGIAGVSAFLAFIMLRFAFTGREKLGRRAAYTTPDSAN